MTINWVGRKFENNLHTAFKESLALFPVDELKVEQRLIIMNIMNAVILHKYVLLILFIIKIVARRDVFGQLPTGYGKSLTFQLLPGVLREHPAENHAVLKYGSTSTLSDFVQILCRVSL